MIATVVRIPYHARTVVERGAVKSFAFSLLAVLLAVSSAPAAPVIPGLAKLPPPTDEDVIGPKKKHPLTDAEVADAMRFAFRHFKIVVEPGGAVGLAAILAGRIGIRGRTIAVVCSGGNVDPALYSEVLAGG